MASGPYQSNLLRFFVGQYWQGLARHRRAVRQTRSNIALGSEIAAAAVLLPVVKVARASQKRLQGLKASATKLGLSKGQARVAAKLFDFSGFDRLSAVSERLNLQALTPFLGEPRLDSAGGPHPSPLPQGEGTGGGGLVSFFGRNGLKLRDSDAFAVEMFGGDAAVGQGAITEAVVAEAAMARTLLAVAGSLSSAQQDDLAAETGMPQVGVDRPAMVRWWQSVRRVVSAALGQQVRSGGGVVREEGPLVTAQEEGSADGLVRSVGTRELSGLAGGLSRTGKVTGVACDVETRSLVLIRDYQWVWKGLSAEQQCQLHQKIEALLADVALVMSDAMAEGWQVTADGLGEFALPGVKGLAKAGSAAMNVAGNSSGEMTEADSAATVLAGAKNSSGLAVPSVSLWVEVLRAVAWLQRRIAVARRLPGQQLRLAGGASALKEGRSVVARLESAIAGVLGGAIVRRTGAAIVRSFSSSGLARQDARQSALERGEKRREQKALEKSRRAEGRDYVDASVVTASYVEHPLEKVLKWLDRFLLWLENGWRRLMDWLRRA